MTPAAAALSLVLAAPPDHAPEPAPSAAAPRVLSYDLRPGDHLVYRQRLERELRSARVESRSEVEWESHVLVLAEREGSWRVGIQRNRTRAELLRYREDGHDRLESERAGFAEALAKRGAAFAETCWLTPSGGALLAWSVVREATSERLPLFHEVEPLPAAAVAPGGSYTSPGLLGLEMKAVGFETVGGEDCLRLEGEEGGTKVRHWHCPSSGTLGRLEYEAEYGGPGGALVKEQYRLERVSLSRGETLDTWLRDASTVRGALTALAAADRLDLAPEALYSLLDGAEADVERLVLAVAWRHRLPPPPPDVLRRLASSPSPRVKALAARFSSPRPEAPDALVRLARDVRSGGELPTWAGPVEAGWGRQALLAQRAPGQVPGATLRFMQTGRFRGRPYVLHVPDDYRGDEPFPLVVVLGGGPGRAIATAQTARSTLEPRGELAVFPQANGMWWEEEPGAAVAALLAEVLADLNVDTDRVTITGFSNGGTGSLLYASRMPHRFAAVASLMGGGLPFFENDRPIDAAAIARIPFLFVHGDTDEIIPSWTSERTAKAMRKANPDAVAEMHVLPGRPHDVVYGRDDDLTFPFLERYLRDPFPKHVALRARSLEYPRAFWAEVVEKGGGVAEIDGTIEGTTIALRTKNVKRLRLRLRRELLDLSQPVRVTIDGREAFAGSARRGPRSHPAQLARDRRPPARPLRRGDAGRPALRAVTSPDPEVPHGHAQLALVVGGREGGVAAEVGEGAEGRARDELDDRRAVRASVADRDERGLPDGGRVANRDAPPVDPDRHLHRASRRVGVAVREIQEEPLAVAVEASRRVALGPLPVSAFDRLRPVEAVRAVVGHLERLDGDDVPRPQEGGEGDQGRRGAADEPFAPGRASRRAAAEHHPDERTHRGQVPHVLHESVGGGPGQGQGASDGDRPVGVVLQAVARGEGGGQHEEREAGEAGEAALGGDVQDGAVRLAVGSLRHRGGRGVLVESGLVAADAPAQQGPLEEKACRRAPHVGPQVEVGLREAAGEARHEGWPAHRDEAGRGDHHQHQRQRRPPDAALAPSSRPEKGHSQRTLDEGGHPGPPLVRQQQRGDGEGQKKLARATRPRPGGQERGESQGSYDDEVLSQPTRVREERVQAPLGGDRPIAPEVDHAGRARRGRAAPARRGRSRGRGPAGAQTCRRRPVAPRSRGRRRGRSRGRPAR